MPIDYDRNNYNDNNNSQNYDNYNDNYLHNYDKYNDNNSHNYDKYNDNNNSSSINKTIVSDFPEKRTDNNSNKPSSSSKKFDNGTPSSVSDSQSSLIDQNNPILEEFKSYNIQQIVEKIESIISLEAYEYASNVLSISLSEYYDSDGHLLEKKKKEIQSNPSLTTAFLFLSVCQIKLKDWIYALQSFKNLLDITSKKNTTYLNMAYIQYKMMNLTHCLLYFKKVTENESDNIDEVDFEIVQKYINYVERLQQQLVQKVDQISQNKSTSSGIAAEIFTPNESHQIPQPKLPQMNKSPNNVCPICTTSFNNKSNCAQFECCKTQFHAKCIANWYKFSKSNDPICAMCQSKQKSKVIQQDDIDLNQDNRNTNINNNNNNSNSSTNTTASLLLSTNTAASSSSSSSSSSSLSSLNDSNNKISGNKRTRELNKKQVIDTSPKKKKQRLIPCPLQQLSNHNSAQCPFKHKK